MPADERERLAEELKRVMEFMNEPASKRRTVRQPPAIPKTASAPEAAKPQAAARVVLPSDSTAAPRLRSISFTPSLLQSVLAGKKVVTRRPIRLGPIDVVDGIALAASGEPIAPLYLAGDRLWVREKWARLIDGDRSTFAYERDGQHRVRWISSRFMPRVAARVFLRVSEVGISRLKSITPGQADAEGVGDAADPVAAFIDLWDSIYGVTESASRHDPWVWAITFVVEKSGEST